MVELKRLSKEAIPAALEKAERYRLLNEPLEAESICRDILRVEADSQRALVTLLLALTDQFDQRLATAFQEARDLLPRLADDYSRKYYLGIICERRAKAHLHRGGPGFGAMAHDWLRQAMEHFEEAIGLRPPGNEDAILRWNTCARILRGNPELAPAPPPTMEEMLE